LNSTIKVEKQYPLYKFTKMIRRIVVSRHECKKGVLCITLVAKQNKARAPRSDKFMFTNSELFCDYRK